MSTSEIQALPAGATFLTYAQVMAMTGVRRSSLYNMIAAGEFPRPFPIGTNQKRFLSVDVQAWMAEKVAAGSSSSIAA